MFCSASIGTHLLRGFLALVLIGTGLYFLSSSSGYVMLLALACFGGAFFLFRGCPMCWLMGLVETIHNQRAKAASGLDKV